MFHELVFKRINSKDIKKVNFGHISITFSSNSLSNATKQRNSQPCDYFLLFGCNHHRSGYDTRNT
jgi:hypothetical protein